MSALPFLQAADVVKSSLDIIDIIQRHVVLKRTGRNYTGLCPFHPDKNPSMSVSRDKGVFKCFSCGVGGDALTFLMKLENKSYGELIRELAEEQGIEILPDHGTVEQAAEKRDLKQKILEMNQAAMAWFAQQLQTEAGASTQAYLAQRGMSQPIIERFQLGYAPEGWQHLVDALTHQFDFVREQPDLLVSAGLANNRLEGHGYYDRFRNRLIVPIFDDRGQVVGFGGRALSEDDKPKYLNSPETPVYVKNRILYGLYQAKETIRQTKTSVVMEGYFDVISAHMGGITQAVGSCGTALTENHLKLLSRMGAEIIYLAFDADDAGTKAALSAINLIEPYMETSDLTVKILTIPTGKDPDDFIRHEGGEAFKALMASARPYLGFKLDTAITGLDTTTPEGRITATNHLTPMLAKISQPIIRAEYVKLYAEKIRVSEDALRQEIFRYEQAQNPRKQPYSTGFKQFPKKGAISRIPSTSLKRNQRIPVPSDNFSELRKPLKPGLVKLEQLLLRWLLFNTETCHIMLPLMKNLNLSHPLHQQILTAVCTGTTEHEDVETIIQQANTRFMGQPELQNTLAELVLTAEQLSFEFDLEDMGHENLCETLRKLIHTYQGQQDLYAQQEHVQHLKTAEQDPIELQYQLREQLAQRLQKRKELIVKQNKGREQ